VSTQYLFTAAEITLETGPQISTIEKMVLIVLANRADLKGHCYPSYETIAKESICSVRTACRAIKSLCDKGLVVKYNNFKSTGYQTSNRYSLRYDVMTGGTDTMAKEPFNSKNRFVGHSDTPSKLVAHKSIAALAG